jgi:hypothetical protein
MQLHVLHGVPYPRFQVPCSARCSLPRIPISFSYSIIKTILLLQHFYPSMIHTHIYIYIYIYLCVCVCVSCPWMWEDWRTAGVFRWQDDCDNICFVSIFTYKFDHFMLGLLSTSEIYWSQTDACTWSHIRVSTCKKERNWWKWYWNKNTRNDHLWVQEGAVVLNKESCSWHNDITHMHMQQKRRKMWPNWYLCKWW